MAQPAFPGIEPIRYLGPDAQPGLAFRYYDKDRIVRGKRMEDHLRMAACYWHTFVWNGFDVFGAGTFTRAWHREGDAVELAQQKAAAAFELFEKLGIPFFCFHDRDVAPEGRTVSESAEILDRLTETLAAGMQKTGVKLLWGTANLFSHPRYMAGAATNPDPEVFAFAAAQVKKALEVTQKLGGANYVLWGGREGYETLLNTDMKRELDQLGRFMNLVVEHKHKIGFKGPLLIEPKPREPTKHQYDYDTATVYAFFQRYGLSTDDFRVNIEANHATLAGHSFEHEVAYALANDVFGSIDMNRGDPPARLGHRPVRQRHRRADAGRGPHRGRRRLHHRWVQLRRQGAPPEHRPGRSFPRPRGRDGQPGPRPADRRQDPVRGQAAGDHRRALRRLEGRPRPRHPRRAS